MSDVKAKVVCIASTKDIATVESNGKPLDLAIGENVKKFHPLGFQVGGSYNITYDPDTNIISYAYKRALETPTVTSTTETKASGTVSNLTNFSSTANEEVKSSVFTKELPAAGEKVKPKSRAKTTTKDLEKVFETLNKVKCNVEKKGNYNYVSWTDAWEEVMKQYPDSTFKVYENSEGFPCFINETAGGFVKVGVIIKGIEHIEYMPVLDFSNKAIKGTSLDVFQINKSIKRGMVKAMAMHGLGLYVYRGEDFPEAEE